MERIKSFLASALFALIIFAGNCLGIMALGFAIVLGGAFALAMRLVGPRIAAKAEKRAETAAGEMPLAEPTAA
jgi:hypothetical protein